MISRDNHDFRLTWAATLSQCRLIGGLITPTSSVAVISAKLTDMVSGDWDLEDHATLLDILGELQRETTRLDDTAEWSKPHCLPGPKNENTVYRGSSGQDSCQQDHDN